MDGLRLPPQLRALLGDDGWFDRSYLLDWALASAAWVIAFVIKAQPPFERDFDRKDPLIDHKQRPNQVGDLLNWSLAFAIPLAVTIGTACVRRSTLEIHHSALALYSGRGLSSLVTEFLKNRVGRLRPDFLARCKWDKELKACTGKLDKIMEGRRSFPSGHSSTAFAAMTFLSLWLAGATGAWCLSRPAANGALRQSKLLGLFLTLLPLVLATWIAVTRLEDYRHHKEDVIVGSLIGIVSSLACYHIYWPSPFSSRDLQAHQGSARRVYGEPDDTVRPGGRSGYDYELTGMEHDNTPLTHV